METYFSYGIWLISLNIKSLKVHMFVKHNFLNFFLFGFGATLGVVLGLLLAFHSETITGGLLGQFGVPRIELMLAVF